MKLEKRSYEIFGTTRALFSERKGINEKAALQS